MSLLPSVPGSQGILEGVVHKIQTYMGGAVFTYKHMDWYTHKKDGFLCLHKLLKNMHTFTKTHKQEFTHI